MTAGKDGSRVRGRGGRNRGGNVAVVEGHWVWEFMSGRVKK